MHVPSEQHIVNSKTNTALVTVLQGRVMFDFLTIVVIVPRTANPSYHQGSQDRKSIAQ